MWLGALVFGSERWFPNAEAFTVYFGLLARIAPFGVREDDAGRREAVVRVPAVGLAGLRDPRPGTIAFVAVMLGSVGFDGFSRVSWWQDAARRAEATPRSRSSNFAGLLAAVGVVAGAYLLAVTVAARVADAGRSLAGAFVGSLVPIALVYAVSHYFTLLVTQGQALIPLSSDPFGWGWDLFGTLDFRPNLAPFSPNTIWYVQVATLVGGHVLGLALAHDRALELFGDTRRALRSQIPLLVLMVLYTVGGLWLLSQG